MGIDLFDPIAHVKAFAEHNHLGLEISETKDAKEMVFAHLEATEKVIKVQVDLTKPGAFFAFKVANKPLPGTPHLGF